MNRHEQSPAESPSSLHPQPSSVASRRGFFDRLAAWALGAAAAAVPLASGLVAFLNPLRQTSRSGAFLPLTPLDMVPADGTPKKFAVIAGHTDAWTVFPPEPIGAVFLQRVGGNGLSGIPVVAWQVICPHAGCAIDFEPSPHGGSFLCPCHAATFNLAGKRAQANSPSPRDMDRLAVEIRNGEVWVKFETFTVGTARKVPT